MLPCNLPQKGEVELVNKFQSKNMTCRSLSHLEFSCGCPREVGSLFCRCTQNSTRGRDNLASLKSCLYAGVRTLAKSCPCKREATPIYRERRSMSCRVQALQVYVLAARGTQKGKPMQEALQSAPSQEAIPASWTSRETLEAVVPWWEESRPLQAARCYFL